MLALVIWAERVTAPPSSGAKVQVIYWDKYTQFEEQALRKIVDEFNATHPNIEVKFLSISDVQTKTLMAIAGGVPPDIAGLFAPDVAQYADANAILPLDDYCDEAGIKEERYNPFFLKRFSTL